VAYVPVWWAGYIWDDDLHLTANPCIVGPLGFKEIWTTNAADVAPLTRSTFWLEHALWGLTPLPYHLVNVLLHAACAVVLWRVLLRLCVPGAWLGAALWALHPVEVESVAWITETKNTESGLFFLLSIFFFLEWLQGKGVQRRAGNGWNYALTLLFAALAMASKSSTVILPVVLCLCAWWVEGRWQWRNVMRVAPLFLMAVAASAVSIWVEKLQLATSVEAQWIRPWPERVVTSGFVVWFYLGKLLWPHPLVANYPRWKIDAGTGLSYLPALAVILILFILWRKRDTWARPWFFAWAYFLVALLPVLGLFDNYIFRYSFVFDHLQYLASMGPLVLVGAGLARVADLAIPSQVGLRSALGAGVLLIVGTLSWQRTWAFENEETLWTDTLARNPNSWLGHNNLGVALAGDGRLKEAEEQYHKSLEIDPDFSSAHINLGIALMQEGRADDAMGQFQAALKIDPNAGNAHSDLGGILFRKGQVDEAMAQFQTAVQIDPINFDAHVNLGSALFQKGRVDEAIAQYEDAQKINPNAAEVHAALGHALVPRGRLDEAMMQFEMALQINPNSADVHAALGDILAQSGRLEEAMAQYQQALEINPDLASTQNNLGNIFFERGQLDEAIDHYQKAVEIAPAYLPARNNLAKAQAMAKEGSHSK
jgi:tetratricopeptide (TPR) repeat protein